MRLVIALIAIAITLPMLPATAEPTLGQTVPRPDSLPPILDAAVDLGVAPDALPVSINVGLDLHDKASLDAFLVAVSDPGSAQFQRFLTQDQFNALYGPTGAQEARVARWLTAAGFTITSTFPNHLLVGATGDAGAVRRAFGVDEHLVLYQGHVKHAAFDAPRFPADIAKFTTGVFGLDDLSQMHPMHTQPVPLVEPKASVGGGCCAFAPADLSTFYDNGKTYTGSGQTEIIAGAYTWQDSDVTTYDSQWGLPALPTGSAQVCAGSGTGCAFDASNSIEVTLDVEMVHAVAPNAIIKNYMSQTTALTDFQSMYNKVVTDNPGHSVSTSWGSCETNSAASYQTQNDNIFSNGNAVGQSWFAASGDNGAKDCGGVSTALVVDHPANAPHMMGTGGTHATCSSGMTATQPACGGYGSESAWTSGGGGVSNVFTKPSYQSGCSVPADGKRDVPDVSMEADTAPGNYVFYNGAWNTVGGTSDAAPQWGGYFTLLNQKIGGTGLGLPGTRIYQLCGGNSFHDVTSGNNGGYNAGVGYDMTTGVGTIDANNLLNNYQATTCSGTVPAAPTGLTASGGAGSVSLSWTDGSNGGCAITSHNIYRSTTSGGETLLASSGTGTTYTDSSVTGGTTYYYKVTAVNSIGESAKSNEASATPTVSCGTGPANDNFACATSISATPYSTTESTTGATTETGEPAPCGSIAATVWFTWTAPGSGTATVSVVNGSTNYDTVLAVYTGSSLSGLTNVACNDDFTGLQSQVSFTCTAGTTYRIQVGGYQGATGTAGFWLAGCAAATNTVPGAPTGLTATGGNGVVNLSWSAPTNNGGATITNYKVYRGTTSGGETLLTTLGNVLSYSDTGVTNGQTYYYKVSAVNSVGEGAQSNEASATPSAPTVPGAPTGLTATPNGATEIDLSWTAPTNNGGSPLTNYKIYRGTTSGGETLYYTTTTTGTTFKNTAGVTTGVTYYYKVTAVNAVGEGAASNEASAKTTAGETTVYSQNFDAGSAPGWTKTGISGTDLWHVDSGCGHYNSPSYSLAYTQASPTCTYDTGARTAGHADYNLSLAGYSTSAHFSFKHWFQVEQGAAGYDVMKVMYSCTGSTFTTLATWDGGSTNPTSWLSQSYNVSSCKGSTLYLRFQFDSVDSFNNGFAGWYIDDVAVTAQ